MKTTMTICILVAAIILGFGCWHLERWVNWKFGYSNEAEALLAQERIARQKEINDLRLSIKLFETTFQGTLFLIEQKIEDLEDMQTKPTGEVK